MFNRLQQTVTHTIALYPRQFWVLFWGMLLNSIGASMIWPFLTIYVKQRLDVPLTTITLVTAADSAARLLVTLLAGPAMDRLGRRGGLLVSLAVSAAALVLMSTAATLGQWIVLAAAFGASNAAYRIGANAMVADLVEPDRRVDAYALIRTAVNMGVAIGPAVGGFIAVASYSLAFYLAAGAHTALLCLTVFFIAESLQPGDQSGRRGIASYGPVLRDRPFMAFIGLLIVGSMPAPMTYVLLPVYLKTNFGMPENLYGFLVTCNAVMVVTLQYAVTRLTRRYRPLPMLALGALLYALGTGSIALGRAFPAFLLSMVVLTFGEMVLFPTATALTANLAPPAMRARYMGIFTLTWGLGSGIGPVIGGLLNDHVAPAAIWYGTLAMGALGALGFLWLERSPRRRDAWTQPGLRATGKIDKVRLPPP